jgi:hypothetical protein
MEGLCHPAFVGQSGENDVTCHTILTLETYQDYENEK